MASAGLASSIMAVPDLVRRRLMFYPRGYEHSLEFLGPTHILAIELDSGRDGFSGPVQATPLPATLYTPVWRAMLKAADGEPPEIVGAAISELLAMIAAFANRSAPACVIDTIDRIHAQWNEVASARALAAQAGVSPQYLCRALQEGDRHHHSAICAAAAARPCPRPVMGNRAPDRRYRRPGPASPIKAISPGL
jgi:hypothetical protein